MDGLYDDGATYGPDPSAEILQTPTDSIYEDGDMYGQDRTDR